MGRFLVTPEKYTLYNCAQLQQTAVPLRVRERELEALIAKAGPSAAGGLVADTAYRPEYYQVHGEMNELRRTVAEKNCKFVLGEPLPGAEPTPAQVTIPR